MSTRKELKQVEGDQEDFFCSLQTAVVLEDVSNATRRSGAREAQGHRLISLRAAVLTAHACLAGRDKQNQKPQAGAALGFRL